ncbi:hypothetical protein P9112_013025 [Eukaryota sp. TZLM1-RC]
MFFSSFLLLHLPLVLFPFSYFNNSPFLYPSLFRWDPNKCLYDPRINKINN